MFRETFFFNFRHILWFIHTFNKKNPILYSDVLNHKTRQFQSRQYNILFEARMEPNVRWKYSKNVTQNIKGIENLIS